MIEVGEYCRSESGQIRKVTRIIPCYENGLLLSDTYYIEFDGLGNIGTYKNNQAKEMFIAKHSKNIIDLIEEGDYVNGSKVIDIAQGKTKAVYIESQEQKFALIPIVEKQIKSIVTKEQMKSVEYIVKE